jgi:Receptor family ligand binding region
MLLFRCSSRFFIIVYVYAFFRISPGAIFSEEQKDTSIELAFKYAVYKINKDRNILPKTTLVYDIQYVPDSTDSFRTSKKVCKSIENGVTAIFGKCVNIKNFIAMKALVPFMFNFHTIMADCLQEHVYRGLTRVSI